MCIVLGAVMLVFSMVNYAHADTAREDAKRLRASKAGSSSLGLARRDSTQGDGVIDNTRRKKRRVFIGISHAPRQNLFWDAPKWTQP